MPSVKTAAIILDTSDVYDADRLYLLLTEQFGKIRARAKGVRRPTSRLTGHLLPFMPTHIEMQERGEFYLITQAQLLTEEGQSTVYPDLPLQFLHHCSQLAAAVNKLLVDKEPQPDIFYGLQYVLNRLRALDQSLESKEKADLLSSEFLFKLLNILGYQPQLDTCAVTGESLTVERIGWSSQAGGLLSEAGMRQIGGGYQIISSPKVVIALRQLASPDFRAERLNMEPEIQQEAIELIKDYSRFYM